MIPGTSLSPLPVSVAVYKQSGILPNLAHIKRFSLNATLDLAASHHTDAIPFAMYTEYCFASVVAAQDASGHIVGIWVSEPMFSSPSAALDHAQDMLGCELFALICDGNGF